MRRFNDWIAVKVTNFVASMWCAYIFAALAIYGATAVDWHNPFQVVQWLSQTFLQLVLLSVIMVGQKVTAFESDQLAIEMHDTTMESHDEIHKALLEIKDMHQEIHTILKAEKRRTKKG